MGDGDGNRARQWESGLAVNVSGADIEAIASELHLCSTRAPTSRRQRQREGCLAPPIYGAGIENTPARYHPHNSMVSQVGAHGTSV